MKLRIDHQIDRNGAHLPVARFQYRNLTGSVSIDNVERLASGKLDTDLSGPFAERHYKPRHYVARIRFTDLVQVTLTENEMKALIKNAKSVIADVKAMTAADPVAIDQT